MNRSKLIEIIETQKKAGKSSQEVLELGEKSGLEPILLEPLIKFVYHQKNPNGLINENQESIYFWDPFDSQVFAGKYRPHLQRLQTEFKKLQQHPSQLFFKSLGNITVFLLGLIGMISLFVISIKNNFIINNESISIIMTIPFLLLFGFMSLGFNKQKKLHRRIRALERDMVKSQFASSVGNWEYAPQHNFLKYKHLCEKFGELIPSKYQKPQSNEYRHYLSDQLWVKQGSVSFYTAIIEHQKIQNHSVDVRGKTMALWFPNDDYQITVNQDHHSEYQTLYAIKLANKVFTPFLLRAKSKSRAWLEQAGVFSNQTLELIDFNQLFYFDCPHRYDLNLWFKRLTPTFQWKVTQLAQQEPGLNILVKDDALIMIRDGKFFDSPPRSLWQKISSGNFQNRKNLFRTNFFRRATIDPRDTALFEQKISIMTELAQKMPKIKA